MLIMHMCINAMDPRFILHARSTTMETPADSHEIYLTTEKVLALWSKTYNTNGKPDWSHIYQYYHPDIVFQDSIQRLEGIESFKALCERLTRRCKQLQMDILSIASSDDMLQGTDGCTGGTPRFILMDWKMTMSFRKSPSTPIYGCTKLTFHEDGRIIGQRDYYDLWGDIFNGIPGFRRLYRKFMYRFFG
jgi:hypothetical protein